MRRLLCVLLALATLCGMSVAADSGFQLTVSSVQRLTPGTAFDPDTAPEVTLVSPGDVIVLTVEFRNDTAAAVDISGFVATINYDATKVTPYKGTSPFSRNPYQNSPKLVSDYAWSAVGNAKDGFVAVAGGGAEPYSVPAGSALVIARVAFQVNADASGEVVFTFDSNKAKSSITRAGGKTLSLAALQPVRVALGGYEITAVSAESVTLTNPAPVTLAVSYFDASGKFMSASTQSVPANAGSVPVAFGSASKAYVMLFDDAFRPLCERCLYVMK